MSDDPTANLSPLVHPFAVVQLKVSIHSKMGRALLCTSIALNAFCAGGMFTFPLMSPALAALNKLSQPQLTSIILVGMISQYPMAIVVGSLIDAHGPASCSLISTFLFSIGFGMFAWETSNPLNGIAHASQATFYRLVFCFLLIGLGTVFSYCSALFTASKSFPIRIGLASGVTMALFGLSPLFFSMVATSFFIDVDTGFLKVPQFSTFLSIVTTVIYTLGFLNFRRFSVNAFGGIGDATVSDDEEAPADEETPLISSDVANHVGHPTAGQVVKQIDFWILALFCTLIIGVCEMVISNIGTIAESLPSSLDESKSNIYTLTSSSSAAFQVKLLSIANTAFRIIVGPVADYISPVAVYLPTGVWTFPRKHVISRFVFLTGAATLISLTFLWMEFAVQSQAHLWVLSVGTGLSYSTVFTILPSLISSMWGLQHLGRNFGLMMFAPFTGTPIFSYLYALVSAAHTEAGEMICKGRSCWQVTFSTGTTTSIFALFLSIVLWRRWYGRI